MCLVIIVTRIIRIGGLQPFVELEQKTLLSNWLIRCSSIFIEIFIRLFTPSSLDRRGETATTLWDELGGNTYYGGG